MKMFFGDIGALFAIGMVVGGCGATDDSPPSGGRLQALDRDLTIGSSGDDVQTVHEYLTRFGYFPNAKLAREYPAWRPLVAEPPADPVVFDEHTADAVRRLQINAGLLTTGFVDQATRAVLSMPRCGVPDGSTGLDGSDKFSFNGSKWSGTFITYKLLNTNDVTFAQARSAVTAAVASWGQTTTLTFSDLTNTNFTGLIQINFAVLDDTGMIGGATAPPASGGDMTLNTTVSWSVASSTPSGSVDLQTVVLHELGHALGISHSGYSGGTMYPFYTGLDRALDVDDKEASSSLYDTYSQLGGAAKDIGAGADGSVWVIGTNAIGSNFGIWKWNGSGWDATVDVAAAIRIAVEPNGVPWVVQSNGSIWRRTSNSPFTGVFQGVPTTAKDIAIGADGSVWKIGTEPLGGGFQVHKWDGFGWGASDGGGVRIAVGPTGIPWVVTSAGLIFRHSNNDAFSGFWELLPGTASDIGIGPGNAAAVDANFGAGTYAWKVRTTTGAHGALFEELTAWNEQSQVTGLDSMGNVVERAPAKQEWGSMVLFGGGGPGIAVSVGPNGRPFIVDNNANILTSQK